jgi:threonine-phosphate decarboxylase
MKPAVDLAKDNFRNLKPCLHGADVLEAAQKTGLNQQEIVDFSSSVNPLGASQKVLDAAKAAFGQIPSYPDSNANALRKAIADHYGVTVDNIAVGNGSTELIYLFADAFMRRGDVAVVAAPSFSEYENAVRKTGEKIKRVKLGKDFSVDADRFVGAMTKKVKIVYLCNPNNPTSKLTPTQTLTTIIEQALKRNILVFLDEDFLEFVEGGEKLSMIRRIGEFPNLFILRSFTKLYGLTGLRVGYGICSKEIACILMNAKIPWNVNCLGQAAAITALGDGEHLQKTLALVKEEKQFLISGLKRFGGFKVYPPDANFLFINTKKTGLTAAELKQRMLMRGVLIRDCTSFAGLDQFYIRVAVKTRPENERLLSAFKDVVG